jgi:hypothetical protein
VFETIAALMTLTFIAVFAFLVHLDRSARKDDAANTSQQGPDAKP